MMLQPRHVFFCWSIAVLAAAYGGSPAAPCRDTVPTLPARYLLGLPQPADDASLRLEIRRLGAFILVPIDLGATRNDEKCDSRYLS